MLPASARKRLDQALAHDLPLVRADRQRIGRAVTNLVTNALKYSSGDSRVRVLLTGEQREVAISVEDHGIGIDADALPRVFERFYRACGVTGPDGLGLGLYITRLLVEAHGGRVSASSVKGAGSTFLFTLPIAPARSPSIPTPQRSWDPEALRRARVAHAHDQRERNGSERNARRIACARVHARRAQCGLCARPSSAPEELRESQKHRIRQMDRGRLRRSARRGVQQWQRWQQRHGWRGGDGRGCWRKRGQRRQRGHDR